MNGTFWIESLGGLLKDLNGISGDVVVRVDILYSLSLVHLVLLLDSCLLALPPTFEERGGGEGYISHLSPMPIPSMPMPTISPSAQPVQHSFAAYYVRTFPRLSLSPFTQTGSAKRVGVTFAPRRIASWRLDWG